jgi:hypothetical protein
MTKIRLSYPRKQHTLEDLRPLFDEFVLAEPKLVDEWRWVEQRHLEIPRYIVDEIDRFLENRTDWDTISARIGAFGDFRRLLRQRLFPPEP